MFFYGTILINISKLFLLPLLMRYRNIQEYLSLGSGKKYESKKVKTLCKVNGYTFRASHFAIFIFCLLIGGQHMKKKNSLLLEQVLSFENKHYLKGLYPSGPSFSKHR